MALEWIDTTFEEVCDIKRGASPRPIHDWLALSGVPWVKISDATAAQTPFIQKTAEYIKKEAAPKSVEVFPGDFILSNSATPGIPKFMQIHACVHDGWLILRNFRNLDKWYCYYLLLNDREKLVRQGNGSVFTNLKTEILKKHQIKLPPLSYQTQVADILKTLDDRITLLQETNQTLDRLAQTIFKSWFINFDPVKANASGLKGSTIDDETLSLFPSAFVESELGEIPEGWTIDRMGNVAVVTDYVANGSFASLKENVTLLDEPGYALYVRTTDYNSGFKGDFRYVSKASYDFLSKSSLEGNEVIISNVGDVGTVFRPPAWLGMPMTLGSNAVALKAPEISKYLYFHFSSEKGQNAIQSIVTGSAQLKFNKTNFRDLKILIPNKRILERFEKITETLLAKHDANKSHIASLKKVRDGLLPKLMSGQISLKNAELETAKSMDRLQ